MLKNIITLSLENIILFFGNITSHFTGEIRNITLVLVIIILSFSNITLCFPNIFNSFNVSALSYQSSVGVGFTFNPTLSVSISPSDLAISNLAPGNTLDSNVINVSVASNASYGYTLYAMMNGNNSDLAHTNNSINNTNNIFSSITTNADLSDLDNSEDTNIWGYSYKDNTVETPTWSNYNGLSSSNSTTLLDTNTNNTETGIDSIDFKIAAKASSAQASGTYTGVINFTAVSDVAPMSLLDSFIASGAEQLNGYYKMQDMTHDICNNVDIEESELQLIDVRDNKVYWVAKLKDGNCWMTQNLDLDLDSNTTYTHWDTDLGWSTENGDSMDENAAWKPTNSTINFNGATTDQVTEWVNSDTEPYSANPGDIYYYTSNSEENDIKYTSLQDCIDEGHNDCTHYHAGDYYNWSAAVASNDASGITSGIASNSICPKGWGLPTYSGSQDFAKMLFLQKITTDLNVSTYTENGFNLARIFPIYLVRSGGVWDWDITFRWGGLYWSNNSGLELSFDYSYFQIRDRSQKKRGLSVRCLAR